MAQNDQPSKTELPFGTELVNELLLEYIVPVPMKSFAM